MPTGIAMLTDGLTTNIVRQHCQAARATGRLSQAGNQPPDGLPTLTYTLYHNPRCGKSRQTLELLRDRGIEPTIVDYLKMPPDAAELRRILSLLGMTPRQLLRKREAEEAGLGDPGLSNDALVAGMVANPITIERPILVTGDRAALGRPPEAVLALL
jgi:arsenate reductase (glutaredoxin)